MRFDVLEAPAAEQISHRISLIVPVLERERRVPAQVTRRIVNDGAERVHDRSVHAEPISPLTHPETAVNGDGWQPITEPPEEGAWVFLWWPTMPIAFAPAVVGFNMFDGCGWELPAWRDYGEVFPTHWCPTTVLPPPPTSADASLAVVGEGGKEEGSSS